MPLNKGVLSFPEHPLFFPPLAGAAERLRCVHPKGTSYGRPHWAIRAGRSTPFRRRAAGVNSRGALRFAPLCTSFLTGAE